MNVKSVGVVSLAEISLGVGSCVAIVTLVAVAPSVTVNVASSLTVPVSSCATGALFTETLIVSVVVVVEVPSVKV